MGWLERLSRRALIGVAYLGAYTIFFAEIIGKWLWKSLVTLPAKFTVFMSSFQVARTLIVFGLVFVPILGMVLAGIYAVEPVSKRAKIAAKPKAPERRPALHASREYGENPLDKDARERGLFKSSLPQIARKAVQPASFVIPEPGFEPIQPGFRWFEVTAYYGPKPGQKCWAQGSYEADIRMNGEGKETASGPRPQRGYIAADRRVPFGTRMRIPGYNPEYAPVSIVMDWSEPPEKGGRIFGDRLDVFMGFGEEGCKLAVAWGKRTVRVEILR